MLRAPKSVQTDLGRAGLGHMASILSCSLSVSVGAQSTQRLLDLCPRHSLAGGISGEARVPQAALPSSGPLADSGAVSPPPPQLQLLWEEAACSQSVSTLSCPSPSLPLPASGFLQCFSRNIWLLPAGSSSCSAFRWEVPPLLLPGCFCSPLSSRLGPRPWCLPVPIPRPPPQLPGRSPRESRQADSLCCLESDSPLAPSRVSRDDPEC